MPAKSKSEQVNSKPAKAKQSTKVKATDKSIASNEEMAIPVEVIQSLVSEQEMSDSEIAANLSNALEAFDVLPEADQQKEIDRVKNESKSGNTEEDQIVELPIGDYKIIISGNSTEAIAKIIREDDLIFEETYNAVELPPVVGNTKRLTAFEAAHLNAIAAYHEAVSTADGLVDINALVEHPYNSLIYGDNEPIDDLVNVLREEDGQVFRVEINSKGQLLAGNRRIRAARCVNQELIEQGKLPKFEFISSEVVNFASPEAEFKHMILHNKVRTKTKKQLDAEIKNLIALSTCPSIPVDAKLTSSEMIDRLRQVLGRQDGKIVSRETAFKVKRVHDATDTYEDETLKSEIRSYANEVPAKAAELVKLEPPKAIDIPKEAYQAKVLERVRANPAESVKRASEAIASEIISDKLASTTVSDGDTATTLAQLIQAAKDAGDIPGDNRKTPEEYAALALDCMGVIDLDSFAMLTDPGYIPARNRYTILDNAFTQEHCGNVFANPPYSKSSEAIALLDGQICAGNVKKLFLILPVSVQSGKSYQKLLKDHNPVILKPNKRLSFEPGELLLAENPNAKGDGNREPSVIVFWSANSDDYQTFHDAAYLLGWVGRAFSLFNPFQLPAVLNKITWHEGDDHGKFSATVFGVAVQVLAEEGGGFSIKLNNHHDKTLTLPNEQVAKRLAIMGAIALLDPGSTF
jgi:hypothetical protein